MHHSKRSLAKFLLLTQGLLLIVYSIVYLAITRVYNLNDHLFVTKIVFLILASSFLLASYVSHHRYTVASRILYSASAIWLGVLFYSFFASLIYFIGVIILLQTNLSISQVVWGKTIFELIAIVSLYGFVNAHTIRTSQLRLSLPNLPLSWVGKRIVFMSDLHLGQVRGRMFANKIAKKTNALNPDIVFIGGDLFDGVKVNPEEIIKPLGQVSSQFGTYFVTGNHEYMGQCAQYITAIEGIGITVLKDEVVDIEGLQIIGVDYRDSTEGEAYDALFKLLTIDDEKPSILLKHTPFHIEIAERNGVSLQLSGHTHQAQMFPGNIITKRLFKGFDYGLKRWKRMGVYTSSGIGTWGPPMRVGTKSEIVVIDLKEEE